MERREKVWSGGSLYQDSLIDYIADLNDALESVPEALRETACISIDCEESYGSYSVTSEVYYMRPETQAEKAQREAQYAAQSEYQRNRDIQELERLKAKLGQA